MYFQFYLPDEFAYTLVEDTEYVKLTHEVRAYMVGVVKSGSTITINGITYGIEDDKIMIPTEEEGEFDKYPLKGMSIEWRNESNDSKIPTTVHLKFVNAPGVDVLVHNDNNPHGYAS